MIIVRGRGATAAELPIGPAAAKDYFGDIPAFLRKIEVVDGIRPLARPGTYLLTHHPMGGFGYEVVMAACLEAAWQGDHMRLAPLDFDLEKVASPHPLVKGFIEGELRLAEPRQDATAAEFAFAVTVEVPIPGVLKLVPGSVLQATADGIMGLRVGGVVRSLFQKVLDDFQLTQAR